MQVPDCEILFASFIRNHLGTFRRIYEGYWSLHFIVQGRLQLGIGEEEFQLEGHWFWGGFPGPLFVQKAGAPLPPGHYRAGLQGALLERWLEEGLWPRQPLQIHDVSRFTAAWEHLLQQLRGTTALHGRRRVHALEGLLLEAWSQQELAGGQALWLERCCRELEAHSDRPADYGKLARQLQIPLPTLRRRFREAMGIPLHRYWLRHRCRLAQARLLETNETIDEISEHLGYDDVAYFSRQFKAITGMSPSRFRRDRYF